MIKCIHSDEEVAAHLKAGTFDPKVMKVGHGRLTRIRRELGLASDRPSSASYLGSISVERFNSMVHKFVNPSEKSRNKPERREDVITLEQAHQIWKEQGGRCSLSGRCLALPPTGHPLPPNTYLASLDRLNNKLGHSFGNVRWIEVPLNKALGDTEDDEALIELCHSVVETHPRNRKYFQCGFSASMRIVDHLTSEVDGGESLKQLVIRSSSGDQMEKLRLTCLAKLNQISSLGRLMDLAGLSVNPSLIGPV